MTATGSNVPSELLDETFAFELFQSESLWDLDCSKLPVDLDADDFDEHGSLFSPLPFCEVGQSDSTSPYTSEETTFYGSALVRRQSARIQDLVRQKLVEEIQKRNEMLDRVGSEIQENEPSSKPCPKQGHRKKPTGKTPQVRGNRRSSKKHSPDLGDLLKEPSAQGLSSDWQRHLVECGYTDEDPTKLWCICRQPHSGRFMICCDRCDEWYHGDCVGVDPQQGAQMEEFICSGCRRVDSSPSSTTAPAAEEHGLSRTDVSATSKSPRPGSQEGSMPISAAATAITTMPTPAQGSTSNIFEKVGLLRPTESSSSLKPKKQPRGTVVPSLQSPVADSSPPLGDAGINVVEASLKEPTHATSRLPRAPVEGTPAGKMESGAGDNCKAPRVASPTSPREPPSVDMTPAPSKATVNVPTEGPQSVKRSSRSWDTPILSHLAASTHPSEGTVGKKEVEVDRPTDTQSTAPQTSLSVRVEASNAATEPRRKQDTAALSAYTIKCLGPLCNNQVFPRIGLYCRPDCLRQSVSDFLRIQQSQTVSEEGPRRIVIVDRKSQSLVPRKRMPCLDESSLIGYLEAHPTCQLISLRRKGPTEKPQKGTETSGPRPPQQEPSPPLSGSAKATVAAAKTSKLTVSEEREHVRRRLSTLLGERIRRARHLYTLSRRRLSQLVLATESAIAHRHCLYRLSQAEESKKNLNNGCQLADFRRHSQLLLKAIETDSKLAHLLLIELISPKQLAACTSEVRLKVLIQSFATGTATAVDMVESSSGQGLKGHKASPALGNQRLPQVLNIDTTAEHERHLYDVNCQRCNPVAKDKTPLDVAVTVRRKPLVTGSAPPETVSVQVADPPIPEATAKPNLFTPDQPVYALSPEAMDSPNSALPVEATSSQHLKRPRPENASGSEGMPLPGPTTKRKSLTNTAMTSTTTSHEPYLSTGLLSLPFPPTMPPPARTKAVACWSGEILLSSRRSGSPDSTLSCTASLTTRMPAATEPGLDSPLLPPVLRVIGGVDARNMPQHLLSALQSGTLEVLVLRLEETSPAAIMAQTARVLRKLRKGCLAAVLGPRLPRTAGCFLYAAPSNTLHLPLLPSSSSSSDELSCDDLSVIIIRELLLPSPSTPSPSSPALSSAIHPTENISPLPTTTPSHARTTGRTFSFPISDPIPSEPAQAAVPAPRANDEDLRVLLRPGVAMDARPPLPSHHPVVLPYSADVDYRFMPQRVQQPQQSALGDEDLRFLLPARPQ